VADEQQKRMETGSTSYEGMHYPHPGFIAADEELLTEYEAALTKKTAYYCRLKTIARKQFYAEPARQQ